MGSVIYSGDRSDRATATDYLERRIAINHAYSSTDFDGWLLEKLAIASGDDILDVGCGSGAQTIPFAKLVGPSGSVSALDISSSSIELLRTRIPPHARVQAEAADMKELAKLIDQVFLVKNYSLVHSSYALYYSQQRLEVLNVMRGALKPGGRCAVFTTDAPHGLVELATRFSQVPSEVLESLQFGSGVLKPYFERHFPRHQVHHFHNVVTVPSADVLIEFYRQTTYFDAAAEQPIRDAVEAEIARSGRFQYEKNGYLIIGFKDG